jgi:probable HAF family extracellular repeat protein
MRTFIFLAVAIFTQLAAAQEGPKWRAVEVPPAAGESQVQLRDINSNGVAVGATGDGIELLFSVSKGARYQNFGPYFLSMQKINSAGAVVGWTSQRADTYFTPVFLAMGEDPLAFIKGTWAEETTDPHAPVRDFADSGDVLGSSNHPWLWSRAKGLRALGDVPAPHYEVQRVNDHGQVVGYKYSNECDGTRAFLFQERTGRYTPIDGGPSNIDTDRCDWYSEATGINNQGHVVGHMNRPGSDAPTERHAFIWRQGTGLVALRNDDPARSDFAPTDINDRGQVVGTYRKTGNGNPERRLFYWDARTGMMDLQDLLDKSDPFSAQVQLRGNGRDIRINKRGLITAHGHLLGDARNAHRAFVLVPVGMSRGPVRH